MSHLGFRLRRLGLTLLFLWVMLCCWQEAQTAPASAPSSPVLAARRTATPPVVDGTPDEAAWREAAWSSAFMDMVDGTPPWLRTEVALLWDDKSLYVAVRMEEPWLEASIAERDGPVYRDPDFELFIAGKDAYWELEVNARTTVYDVFWIWRDAFAVSTAPNTPSFNPIRWDALKRRVMLLSGIGEHRHPRGERVGFIDEDLRGAKVAVVASGTLNDNSDTDKGWTVEMAIPWAALQDLGADVMVPPSPGAILSMNLSRFVSRTAQGVALPPLRPSAWTLTRHGVFDSHMPERFAQVIFTEGEAWGLPTLPTEAELRAYLQAHLSAADRLILGSEVDKFINKHAAFVSRVVAEAPWKDKLTSELVRAWLLPVRVTGEPLEPWQEALRAELLPVLAASSANATVSTAVSPIDPATDLTEAALRVRQWLSTRTVPGLSPPWSLGPLALLQAGAGRCEELGILFVNAARAVGIPARIAYVPAWRGADGNHLWVEFWNGAQWVVLSPEQPDAPPGTGWFYPQLDKVAVVHTRGFGANAASASDSLQQGERLLFSRDGIFTRNRTAAYTTTGTLRVRGASAPHEQSLAQSVPVEAHVYVFNGGRPRAVASGHGADLSFELGTGSYLLSVAREGVTSLHSVTVLTGTTTEHVITAQAAQVSPQVPVYVNESHGYTPPPPRTFTPAAGVSQRPFPPSVPSPVGEITLTDSLYAKPEILRHEAQLAQEAWRSFWGLRADAGGLTEPSELSALFAPHVLFHRVDDEPFSHWREGMSALLRGASATAAPASALAPVIVPGDAPATAQNVRRLLAERHPAAGGSSYTLTTLVPLSSLLVSQAAPLPAPLPDRIWSGLCVAALRSAGIPARLGTSGLRPGMGGGVWAEYYDGAAWQYLLRSDTGYAANEAHRQYGEQGIFPFASRKLNPADAHRTWSVCRTGRGGELFAVPLTFTDESVLRLPVGEYILVTGQRDAQGLAQWRAEPVRVE